LELKECEANGSEALTKSKVYFEKRIDDLKAELQQLENVEFNSA
jgi:hypothetical protein